MYLAPHNHIAIYLCQDKWLFVSKDLEILNKDVELIKQEATVYYAKDEETNLLKQSNIENILDTILKKYGDKNESNND